MKLPKYFNKLSLVEKEAYLVGKLKINHKENDEIMSLLGKVRGGYEFEETEPVATLDYEKPEK